MLQQFVDGPFGAIAELDILDQIDVADKRKLPEQVSQGNLVVRARNPHRQRIGRTLSQKIEIGPADVVDELQPVVARSAKQIETVVGIFDNVVIVAAAEDIGIAAF